MPEYIVERCSHLLNNEAKSIKKANILISGVAYKPDIDDYRESPALKVIDIFEKMGANITVFDPYIKEYHFQNKTHECLTEINYKDLKNYDLVVITTDHHNIDYEEMCTNAKQVFDSRNATKDVKNRKNIELL